MKALLGALTLIGIAAAGVVTGCSNEETTEDKVIEACTDTLLQYRPIGPSGPHGFVSTDDATFLEMSFDNLSASSSDTSGVTETWIVEGTGTAEWEKRVRTNVWDDDGKPDPLPSVTERFSCEVGYRTSDNAVVVFEYTTYHPTSGGSSGRVLVDRQNSGG